PHTPHPSYISTLPLHDALPIFDHRHDELRGLAQRVDRLEERAPHLTPHRLDAHVGPRLRTRDRPAPAPADGREAHPGARRVADLDRKSTRLNSSHEWISYAVFC